MSAPPLSLRLAAVAALLFGACTDDYALLDALPGTWQQETDGSLIEFTRSPTPLFHEGEEFQGRAVTSGGGLVALVTEFRSDCADVEVGFLWAVVDRSKYGNMRFALDPDFSSASSSDACQAGGISFEYPVLKSKARSFTVGVPEVEFVGLEADEIETFTALSLDILDDDRPPGADGGRPADGGTPPTGEPFGGGGIAEGDRVVFYNAGASQVVARALQPFRPELGSELTLTSGSDFGTIEADTPLAVWAVERAAPEGDLSRYAYLVDEAVSEDHALETYDGTAPSSLQPKGAGTVFSGQAIRFEEVGTCGGLGFAQCPSAGAAVVRIYSLFIEDPANPMARGSQLLTFDRSTHVLAEPRDEGDAFQLWIVQEL